MTKNSKTKHCYCFCVGLNGSTTTITTTKQNSDHHHQYRLVFYAKKNFCFWNQQTKPNKPDKQICFWHWTIILQKKKKIKFQTRKIEFDNKVELYRFFFLVGCLVKNGQYANIVVRQSIFSFFGPRKRIDCRTTMNKTKMKMTA